MAELAWHFTNGRLRDGQPVPPVGVTLRHEGPLVLCESGLHASERLIDALFYAPGTTLHRVRVGGSIVRSADKLVCSKRTILASVDATRMLHEFACWCATGVLDREEAEGRSVDPRSRRAIEVKLAWLDGKATDKELAGARADARTAARAAARAAAWAASADARAAAWAASADAMDASWNASADARTAARAAAWAAAWAASADARAAARAASADAMDASWNASADARTAARAAAWAASWNASWAAAWDASWAASWAAAWDAQNAELERRAFVLLAEQGYSEVANG